MNNNIFNAKDLFVIAEVGVNHEGSIQKAFELCDAAKESGADAVKFQSYKANTLAHPQSPGYWDFASESTENQFSLFSKYDKFTVSDYIKLYKYCKKIDLIFATTVFDISLVNSLNYTQKFYKIASADITNIPLIESIAKKKKPIILSTGASNLNEIMFAKNLIRQFNDSDIVIMHCILNYPTLIENANLSMIESIKYNFPDCIVGYSDHTLPTQDLTNLTTAYLLGATVVEKHFTLDKKLPGNDHYHSMDPYDLKKFRSKIEQIKLSLGNNFKEPIESEEISRKNARRSIFSKKNLKSGHILSERDLITLRPIIGIPAENWQKVIGRKLLRNISINEPLNWDDLDAK